MQKLQSAPFISCITISYKMYKLIIKAKKIPGVALTYKICRQDIFTLIFYENSSRACKLKLKKNLFIFLHRTSLLTIFYYNIELSTIFLEFLVFLFVYVKILTFI